MFGSNFFYAGFLSSHSSLECTFSFSFYEQNVERKGGKMYISVAGTLNTLPSTNYYSDDKEAHWRGLGREYIKRLLLLIPTYEKMLIVKKGQVPVRVENQWNNTFSDHVSAD